MVGITNQQLYLIIGVPVIFNVEAVLDARLKHLEESR